MASAAQPAPAEPWAMAAPAVQVVSPVAAEPVVRAEPVASAEPVVRAEPVASAAPGARAEPVASAAPGARAEPVASAARALPTRSRSQRISATCKTPPADHSRSYRGL